MEIGVVISIILAIVTIVLGTIISIMGYFLKKSLERIDKLEEKSAVNEINVSVLVNDHKNKYDHMIEKFDSLTKSIDALSIKIETLNRELKNN